MYLLDTDILSNLMKRAPASTLVARLARVPPEDQFTSSVTLGELLYGAYRSSRTATLLERIEETLLPELPILPFDTAAARRYGELRELLERRGTPIGDADTRVASIALSRGLTVVTGNERHFRQVPQLEVENWLRS
ncbi:MAG: type II toxin-antitoxin system VapC family toxin [Actinomycetota bacterium]|nr:type II toxin-antitoxin system VapC family toxin [Actinomycetota bacterium]